MKKVFLAISTISLIWIVFAAFLSGRAINNIIVLQNKNTSCRNYSFQKGFFIATPNCSGTRELASKSAGIKFNSFGHPTIEPGHEKNKKRIAILGGSTLAGLTMSEHFIEDEFAKLWNESFDEDVEVVNLSVEGYTLTHHAIDLAENIEHYRPDAVVLSTSLDSKMINDAILSGQVVPPYQRLRRGSEIYPSYLLYLMKKIETLKKVVRTIHLNWIHLRFSSLLSSKNAPSSESIERLVLEPNLKLLNYFKSVCDKNGIELHVLVEGEKLTNRYTQKLSEVGTINRFMASFGESVEIDGKVFDRYFQKNGIDVLRIPMPKGDQFYIDDTKYFSSKGFISFFSKFIAKLKGTGGHK